MGLGRRSFLKLAGLALAGIAVDPLQAVVTHNNAYVNKQLGVLFYKPNDWGFIQVKDFGTLKDEQIIGNGLEHIKDDILRMIDDPICVITKYHQGLEKYENTFSPTITLHITPAKELEDIEHQSLEELMELSEQGTSMILQDFKVVNRYDPYRINDCNFYEYDATYTFEHDRLDQVLPVELKVIKAYHNGLYYDINCHQSIAAGQIAVEQFESFKRSIQLI